MTHDLPTRRPARVAAKLVPWLSVSSNSRLGFRLRPWTLLVLAFGAVSVSGCGGDKEESSSSDDAFEVADDDSGGSGKSGDRDSKSNDQGSTNVRADGGTGVIGDSGSGMSGVGRGIPTSTGGGSERPITPPPKPPSGITADALDQLILPAKGTPKQLLQFVMDSLGAPIRARPEDAERELTDRYKTAIEATQIVLAHKDATDIERRQAADLKFRLLDQLLQRGEPGVGEHMLVFAKSLVGNSDGELDNMGRLMVLQMELSNALEEETPDPNKFAALSDQVVAIAKDMEPSMLVFNNLVSATMEILRAEQFGPGRAAVDAIVTAYSGQERFEQLLRNVVERSRYFEFRLDKTLREVMNGDITKADKLRDDTQRFLAQPNPGMETLQQVVIIATGLERMEQYDSAKSLYAKMVSTFEDSPEESLKEQIRLIRDAADTRIGMLGKPVSVQGAMFDGKLFDIREYAGKVVYLVFWGSADGSFIQFELPELVKLRDIYQPRGFEVVGVNIDPSADDARNFLSYQPMPWKTIIASQTQGNLPAKFGIIASPFAVLIDQKGEVVRIHMNAQSLPDELTRMLGTPPESVAPPTGQPANGQSETPSTIRGPAPGRPTTGGGTAPPPVPDPPVTEATTDTATTDTATADKPAGDTVADDEKDLPELPPLKDSNPYSARKGMTPQQLVQYLQRMEDRPVGLRDRPGFREAVVDAASRLAHSDAPEKWVVLGLETQLRWLHAISMVDDAPEQIAAAVRVAVTQLDHENDSVRTWAELIVLEADALEVDDMEIDQVPELIERLREYFAEVVPGEQHLRLASATIHAVNRIDVEAREEHFQAFGEAFSQSKFRKLSSYGKKIRGEAGDNAMGDLVGKPLNLRGQTGLGTPLDWESYRGQVVLVDFWATWCGPCMRAAPDIRALHDKYHEDGFDVVGVNLDRDPAALTEYLDKENPPWVNVVGNDAKTLAEEMSIRGIPALLLVNQEGQVVAASHSVSEIANELKKLLK